MKKILAALMTLVIIVSMTACGGSSTPAPSAASPAAGSSAANDTPAAPAEAATSDYNWPVKTIELVVHAAAGGDTDFNARTFAQYFNEVTGVNMIITNMAGGGGSVATSHVMNSKNDGSIALFTHSGPMIINEVAGVTDYNYTAFDMVGIIAVDQGSVIVASKASGITSIDELKAKAESGTVTYGTELGGYSHLQGLILSDAMGVNFKFVDTGSAADKIQNLLGGRVDVCLIPYGNLVDYEATGDLVMLAQYAAERNKFIDHIPTVRECGYDVYMDNPYIMAFPKGTNPELVKAVQDTVPTVEAIPGYAEALETSFRQPVLFYIGDDAIKVLDEKREMYSKFGDLLKGN